MKSCAVLTVVMSLGAAAYAQGIINPFEDNEMVIALYHFNEESGSGIVDASGNGHDGTMSDGERVDGAHLTGIQLTSPDGKVDLGDLDIDTTFTIECWVYPTSLEGTNYIIQKMGADSTDNFQLAIIDGNIVGGADLVPVSGIYNPGAERRVEASLPTADRWYYIALVWEGTNDGSYLRLYVDGEREAGAAAQFFALANNDNPAYIGWAESAGSFSGIIDEVRISKYDMTREDVMMSYQNALISSSVRRFRSNENGLCRAGQGLTSYRIYGINGATVGRTSQSSASLSPRIIVNERNAVLSVRPVR